MGLSIAEQSWSKARAFFVHVVLSALVFCSVFYIFFTQWYPEPFFTMDGGWRGVKLIAIVDLVVGPCLTLIVYRAGKKYLVFDLLTIAVIQIFFLIYGVWTLYNHRPIAIVYYSGEFFSIDAYQYRNDPSRVDLIKSSFHETPAYIYVDLPDNEDEVNKMRREAMMRGETLLLQTQFYRDFNRYTNAVLADARDVTEFFGQYPKERDKVNAWLDVRLATMSDYVFVPVNSRFQRGLMAINTNNDEPVGYVDVQLPNFLELPYIRDAEKIQ